MPTKRNYLIKVIDAKIVDVKRALEAKGIKLESIYEMYKEVLEPEKVAAPAASGGATAPAASSPPQMEGQAAPAEGKPAEGEKATPSSTSN